MADNYNLADIDEPLVREDGVLVSPISKASSSSRPMFEKIPAMRDVQRHHAKMQKQLSEMPLPAKQLNVVSLVCSYTLMGLSDKDISTATGLTIERIENIKMLDAYMSVYQNIVDAIINTETDDIRSLITANAKNAVQAVVDVMDKGEFETNRLAAAKDILDRSGNRPVDVIEHRHTMEGGLRIEIIEGTNLDNAQIDLDAEEIV